jgi:hypothetical protein
MEKSSRQGNSILAGTIVSSENRTIFYAEELIRFRELLTLLLLLRGRGRGFFRRGRAVSRAAFGAGSVIS